MSEKCARELHELIKTERKSNRKSKFTALTKSRNEAALLPKLGRSI